MIMRYTPDAPQSRGGTAAGVCVGDLGDVLTYRQFVLGGVACIVLAAAAPRAYAQRADENVVISAEDAFGTKVGSDSVGLYDARSARGFDPQQAGNIRVEGLYFDQQGNFGVRLTKSTTMRIGLSAQSYPFPAPTGIADIAVQQPADHTVVSAAVTYANPRGQSAVAIDMGTPLVGDKLGMVAGINRFHLSNEQGTGGGGLTMATLFRWRPNDTIELMPFYFQNQILNTEVPVSVFTGGNYLPPEVGRDHFFGQKWAARRSTDHNVGVIGRAALWENWRLQGAVFRSESLRQHNYVAFLRNVQPNGTGNLDILKYPAHFSGSYSGEVRASGVYTDGQFRHTIHIAARGRDTERLFGGGSTVSFGPTQIGVYRPLAEPVYTLGVRDKDVVKQVTPGASYVGQWANVGEFSVGVQKSFYHRDFGKEGGAAATTSSRPLLYNGTIAWYPTKSLAIYGGYTRGLEEFGTAPDNAANGGEPLPAKLTKQLDAGVRYRIMPGLNVMAGVFEVTKPYFDRNTVNVYTDVGSLRHRGIEMSLAGKVLPNVTVIAGAVFLQARASGLTVDQGLIGNVPPGTAPRLIRANVQYDFEHLKGFSVDGQVELIGSQYANRVNTLRVGSANTLSLGARYAFTVMDKRATLRLQVTNVTDVYDWYVEGASGRLYPSLPRTLSARLAADF